MIDKDATSFGAKLRSVFRIDPMRICQPESTFTNRESCRRLLVACVAIGTLTTSVAAQGTRTTDTYRRIKTELNAVPAIDTHDHLFPFDRLPAREKTPDGEQVNLCSIWRNSYLPQLARITPWKPEGTFADWWAEAKDDFDNVRSASYYRYTALAIRDLYGIDFDTITDEQAADLNQQIVAHYREQNWIYEAVTERANIELMFNDPYWDRYGFKISYPWEVLVFNVTPLVRGFHPSEFPSDADSPYVFAKNHGLAIESLDDYLKVLEAMFLEATDRGAVCLKTTLAYQRTLFFDNVPKDRAAAAFGQRGAMLTAAQIKDFEDFIMWRLCEFSAKYQLPFQIHTGHGRILDEGSNPMNLVNLIDANNKTKFILFHGGYPWVGETGIIVHRYSSRVWIDSVWLPMLSYSTAKRAFHEWLDTMPSNRIMWGADCNHAEGIYGATELNRQCIAEVLAEKVLNGDLREDQALRIGRQILRDNALELFPQLKDRLWKHTGKRMTPAG